MRRTDRRLFLRGLAVSAPLCFSASQYSLSQEADESDVAELFANNLIIDGALRPYPKDDSWLLIKGEVKRRSGVDIALLTVSIDGLANQQDFFKKQADFYQLIQTYEDLGRAQKDGKCGIVLYVQQGVSLKGEIDRLLEWKKFGLRVLQFTYSGRNELGGGSDVDDEPLSELGKVTLKACNANGILVDVSHCGKRTTLDIAHGSSKPVTANHANAEALCTNSRNKSLEEIKAIAATGGVIGITTIGTFLKPVRFLKPKKGEKVLKAAEGERASIIDFLNQIDYMVENVGIDHVGVGSDCWLDGQQVNPEIHNTDRFLNSYKRWYYVASGLKKRGYKDTDLIKIFGSNFARVFKSTFNNDRFDPVHK